MHVGRANLCPTPTLALSMRKSTRNGRPRIAESAFATGLGSAPEGDGVMLRPMSCGARRPFPLVVRTVGEPRYPQVSVRRTYHRRHGGALGARFQPVPGRRSHHNMFGDIPVGRGFRNRRQPGGLAARSMPVSSHAVPSAAMAPPRYRKGRPSQTTRLAAAARPRCCWGGWANGENRVHAAARGRSIRARRGPSRTPECRTPSWRARWARRGIFGTCVPGSLM